MKRTTRFFLAAAAAISLAGCNAPRSDTTTGGTGSESGSMSGGTSDTSATGGTMTDTGRMGSDTSSR
jgi:hypothetical protein